VGAWLARDGGGEVTTQLSGRSRQRLKTEVLRQRPHQLPIFGGRPLQAEPGVIVVGRFVFVAPQATGPQIDDLHTSAEGGDFQTQVKVDAHHHGQLADEHQPVCRHVAEKANGFVGDAVEHSEEIRQLMPLDPAVGKHAQMAQQGP